MGKLTTDAIIFGLAYLNGPKASLSFGGVGSVMQITPRARSALNCLLNNGYAETAEPTDQIKGREHYRGLKSDLGFLAKMEAIDPFSDEFCWPTFVKNEATQCTARAVKPQCPADLARMIKQADGE